MPDKLYFKASGLPILEKGALLHGSKKVPYVILAKSGNLEKL
ncbi:hypothetical protein [Rickettsia endosymbiont of Orchestes rusci]